MLSGEGKPIPLKGRKQRLLLGGLLLQAPRVAATDLLIELLWRDGLPEDPAAALQTQVSRLRKVLRQAGVDSDQPARESHGYRLEPGPDEVDAARFEALVAEASGAPTPEDALGRIDQALRLWRGEPFEEFAGEMEFLGEVTRLKELRTGALVRRAELLLALGRTDEALLATEPLVREDPLREQPRALSMEALYRSGRQSEALEVFDRYRTLLSEELGLDPSPGLRQLRLEILRHERALAPVASSTETPGRPLESSDALGTQTEHVVLDAPALRVAFLPRSGGRLAYAVAGQGPPLVVPPAWCSSLAATGAGIDPRSAFLAHLSQHLRLVLYDRAGMGLSTGAVNGLSVDTDVAELLTVLNAVDLERVSLLAVSQAGPVALAFAARYPDRVSRMVLLGTYADGPRTFARPEVSASMLAMVRAHWGIGSHLLAGMLVPDASAEEAEAFARMQREAATPELAARALAQIYATDVSSLLPSIPHRTLVIHYTGDRAIPFRASEEIAMHLPAAELIPMPGRSHLPQASDLGRISDLISEFVAS